MKFSTIAFILSMHCCTAIGQARLPWALHAKFSNFLLEKQADSAILCYEKIRAGYSDALRTSYPYRIATCFLNLNDTAKAIQYFSECLALNRQLDSGTDFQAKTCYQLANIYFARKQFRKTLLYMDSGAIQYKPHVTPCSGGVGYEIAVQSSYRRAQCYLGLQSADSAIIEMAPVILDPVYFDIQDSVPQAPYQLFFVNLVQTTLGCDEAKKRLLHTLNSFKYQLQYQQYSNGLVMVKSNCSISFFNTPIHLWHWQSFPVNTINETPPELDKTYLLKKLSSIPAVQMILLGSIDNFDEKVVYALSPSPD